MAGEASLTPEVMYGWRVQALMDWMERRKGLLHMDHFKEAGHLDQFHYLGLECNDDIISILQLAAGKKVLDVGSGIGGPARYISWRTGCEVVGLEIQESLVRASQEVSTMLGIGDKVTFRTCDATTDAFKDEEQYDAFFSILVFLHIPREPREVLFKKLHRSLKLSGSFCIEDYFLRDQSKPFTAWETRALKDIVGAVDLPSQAAYKTQLEDAGFTNIQFEDMTSTWTQWTKARRDIFEAKKLEQVALHGPEIVANIETFYSTVERLFAGGRLGGVRISGSRQAECDELVQGRKVIQRKKERSNEEIVLNASSQL